MTRDEERFLDCLKKSKSKTLVRVGTETTTDYYYFSDVNQTGWSFYTIADMFEQGLINLEIIGTDLYRVTK